MKKETSESANLEKIAELSQAIKSLSEELVNTVHPWKTFGMCTYKFLRLYPTTMRVSYKAIGPGGGRYARSREAALYYEGMVETLEMDCVTEPRGEYQFPFHCQRIYQSACSLDRWLRWKDCEPDARLM